MVKSNFSHKTRIAAGAAAACNLEDLRPAVRRCANLPLWAKRVVPRPISSRRMGVPCSWEVAIELAEVDAYLRARPGAENGFKAEWQCGAIRWVSPILFGLVPSGAHA